MKLSLRSLFFVLIVPLAATVVALLLAALIPFFAIRRDIRDIERDLAYGDAVLEAASAFTEQGREYADLVVMEEGGQDAEIRRCAEKVRRALLQWRNTSQDDPDDARMIQQIESAHAQITERGEKIIELVAAHRRDEARRVLLEEVHPRVLAMAGSIDQSLVQYRKDMARHVARADGGVHYSGSLRLSRLDPLIGSLDAHIREVIESAALRRMIEREAQALWYLPITDQSRELVDDIAVDRYRAAAVQTAWRDAIVSGHGGGPNRHVRFFDQTARDYRLVRSQSDEVMRLIALGQQDDATKILERSLEFERMPIVRSLLQYTGGEARAAKANLDALKREAAHIRNILLAGSALTALLGLTVPWLLSRKLITPLRNLQEAAQRIGGGNLDTRVETPSIREMAQLATTFNQMAGDLAVSREQLRMSEERFQFATRATNDMVWDLDVAAGESWVSEGFRSRFTLNGHEKMPMSAWIDLIHPDDRAAAAESLTAAFERSDEYWSAEYRLRQPDGTYACMYDRGWIMRDAQGKAIRVIGANTDITERKMAEHAIAALNRQKEMILDSVGDGILGLDARAHVISANPAAARMLGFDPADLIGKPMSAILAPMDADGEPRDFDDSAIRRTLARGTLERIEKKCFLRADHSSFPVEYRSNAMCDERGKVIGAVVTFRDVTQEHEIERMKSEFVSTVSHELRTPLTSIRGALGLLHAGLLGKVSDKGQRMLDLAVSNTDRLVRLINDILDIERLDSGQITFDRREVDISKFMTYAVELMKPMADKAGVALRFEPYAGTMHADQDRMIQVMANLLSNAIKFSTPGTTIAAGVERRGNTLLFRVSDEGRGIPEEKLETIFERFQQVDASDSRDKGGTGLGLSICRSIVQQHGGRLWAESVLGEGSTFYFTVPDSRELPAFTESIERRAVRV